MQALIRYLGQLALPKRVLWCYLLWYLTMAGWYFEPSLRLWLTSLGISLLIGTGLILSVLSPGAPRPDFWTTARLYLMPFCVSSFAALIKDRGFVLIVSPEWQANITAIVLCATFWGVTRLVK